MADTHFLSHRLPLSSSSLTNLRDTIISLTDLRMRKLYRFGILLTAATDLLLGFASLNSRRKSSLSMKVNQFKIEKKSSEDNVRLKRLWGLQEDEEGTWRSLRFVRILGRRRRLLLPSSGFESGEIEIKIEVREVLQTKRRRERPLIGARRFGFGLAAFHRVKRVRKRRIVWDSDWVGRSELFFTVVSFFFFVQNRGFFCSSICGIINLKIIILDFNLK